MGLRNALGDLALPSAARAAGTYVSGPVANAGAAADVMVLVHCTAATGTPTLNVSLEGSDDGETWSAIPGSAVPQLAAAGNAVGNARPARNYVRVTSTVAGTTPSVTYRVAVLVIPG